MKRLPSIIAVLAAGTTLAVACGDDGPPVPGTVTVSLATPNTDDGAVAVSMSGPGITSLTPASGTYLIYWRLVGAEQLDALVFGNVTGGPLFSLAVADGRNPGRYSGSVTEVARRNDELRPNVTGYAVTVTAVP